MNGLTWILLFSLSATAVSDVPYSGTSSQGGMSGFLFLPESEVLGEGGLRVQARLEYLSLRQGGGNSLSMPLSVTWGLSDKLELGGEVPLFLDDGIADGGVLGDVTAGCSWLYETARGGSNLILRGMLTLPTGTEGRDPGTELDLGITTGTTFRLFKLQMSAFYFVNGGRDLFTDDVDDGLRYSAGGTSFLSEDLEVSAALEGTTLGALSASATVAFSALEGTTFFWTLWAGLDGAESYGISLGAAWTGSGF